MPKKKAPKKTVKKNKSVKKSKDLDLDDDDDIDDEFEGDVGQEPDEVGAEPVYSKDDDDL